MKSDLIENLRVEVIATDIPEESVCIFTNVCTKDSNDTITIGSARSKEVKRNRQSK